MADLRPRNMTQAELAEKLREAGFPACSKTAVSLAERSKESGVQFTPAARKAAQGLLNSARRAENRANPNKTTVWLDDELREWVETQAYMEGISVGQLLRRIIWQAKHDYSILRNPMTGEPYSFAKGDGAHCAPLQADRLSALQADRLSALQAGRLPALQTEKAAAEGKAP